VPSWGSEGNVVKPYEPKTAKPLNLNTAFRLLDHFGGQWVLDHRWTGKTSSNQVLTPQGRLRGPAPTARDCDRQDPDLPDLKLAHGFDRPSRARQAKAPSSKPEPKTGHRSLTVTGVVAQQSTAGKTN